MLPPELHTILANCILFDRVDIDHLGHILEGCGRMTLAEGEALLEPGAENHWLYIVLDGELRVYPGGRETPEHAALGRGECVGEISLIDRRGVSALVVASQPSEVFILDHEVLWTLMDLSGAIARNLLTILAGRVRRDNLAIANNHQQSREFARSASVDPVSGLHSKRWVLENFPRFLRRAHHSSQPLCLAMLDLDNFMAFNERHGIALGDMLLHSIAERLAERLRARDLIARYDACSFIVLLPETDIDTAMLIAERLRRVVAATSLPIAAEDSPTDGVTVSCGVALLHPDENLEHLLGAAEYALLQAKSSGRDRVVQAP